MNERQMAILEKLRSMLRKGQKGSRELWKAASQAVRGGEFRATERGVREALLGSITEAVGRAPKAAAVTEEIAKPLGLGRRVVKGLGGKFGTSLALVGLASNVKDLMDAKGALDEAKLYDEAEVQSPAAYMETRRGYELDAGRAARLARRDPAAYAILQQMLGGGEQPPQLAYGQQMVGRPLEKGRPTDDYEIARVLQALGAN